MRYTGPKNKVARREMFDLGLKTSGTKSHASLLKKLNITPGQHGAKGKRKVSEHGKQLREKQKLRFMFGVTETQLKNYYEQSKKKTGNTSMYLSIFLEKRLDNIVYRLGFAPTRAAARQLVSHNHIKVNNKLLNVASYSVKVNDEISLAHDKTAKIPAVEMSLGKKDILPPEWLAREGNIGKLVVDPSADILTKQLNLRLVIEFYSR